MDVLKSYAHQVVSYHPEKLRDDLFAEIYDELCEEFSDWHGLNPQSSKEDFLNACREHPMRYSTKLASEGSAYLIGPQFYFSFVSALKIGAVITAGLYLMLAVISALSSGEYWGSFWRMMTAIPESLLWVSASILGVFIALEKSGERASWLDDWTASELKPIDSHQQISRAETFTDLGISTLGLLWLADIIRLPVLFGRDGAWITEWTIHLPTWFWIAAVALLAFDVAYCLLRLMKAFWSKRLRVTTIVTNLLWVALLAYAVVQPQLLTTQGQVSLEVQGLLPLANKALHGVLIVSCIILVSDTLKHLWRLLR